MGHTFLVLLSSLLLFGCGEPECGDGKIQEGESCDDSNNADGDGCDQNCTLSACGNQITAPNEVCDDGNTISGDGCRNDCGALELCGDSIVQAGLGEECDDGDNDNSDDCIIDPTSGVLCQNASCGDTFVRTGAEICDDGNNNDEDGCRGDCAATELCGDGVIQIGLGEECDDANTNDSDTCPSTCRIAFCGDGFVLAGTEECDDGNTSDGDGCESSCLLSCGNGVLDLAGGEECDDGGVLNDDGCDADCTLSRITQLAVGAFHTCALFSSGNVRCWGLANNGVLGYANTNNIGDDETPASAGNVNVGGRVVQLTAGSLHTCALLDTGSVRCWGEAEDGKLGYASLNDIGDDETPASAGDVDVGGAVIQIAAGGRHTCALLSGGNVRCWGDAEDGKLGYANNNNIGDNETPSSAGDVNVGGTVVQIAAGGGHTCALLDTGSVRCWGEAEDGKLGYGNENVIGDNETPASAGDVNVGGIVARIIGGFLHTCAILDTGAIRCWGLNNSGQLGYGNLDDIGDNEAPAAAGDVNVGGTVVQIGGGENHTCALLNTGSVRCWGRAEFGQLGYGNLDDIGDDEAPSSAGDVNVGGAAHTLAVGTFRNCVILGINEVRCWGFGRSGELGYGGFSNIGDDEAPISTGNVNVGGVVVQVSTGGGHTCALLDTGSVRCWGFGPDGRLGYGNPNSIGDNEVPASAGDISLGGNAIAIVTGSLHTCALLDAGNVRCWGPNISGRLGYGNPNLVGDDETPASVGDVNIGGVAVQITAGGSHTCVLLDTGSVRCWGAGAGGVLGYGNTDNIGDDETPASAGDINIGGVIAQIIAGGGHTCVLLDTGNIRCWGFGLGGLLGYGDTNNIGDDETPASVGDVDVGGTVLQIAAGSAHTCVLLDAGNVRCWGDNFFGQLGYANNNNIGDNEAPSSAGDVNVGGTVVQIAAGGGHTCVLLTTGSVRCWGDNSIDNFLGYGNTNIVNFIGDDETPESAGDINLGVATTITTGIRHTCALLGLGGLRCWGQNSFGQLGYGHLNNIGDDEVPAALGPDVFLIAPISGFE